MATYKTHQFKEFKKLLEFVFNNKYSNFYRVKFREAGFNPDYDFRSLEDVKKIPFLTKDELVKQESLRLLFISEEEVGIVSFTSGTTGEPLCVFHSKNLLGCPPVLHHQKKILILFPPFSAPLINYYIHKHPDKQVRVKYSVVGDISNLPVSCQLASRLGIDHIICTTASLAIVLKSYLVNYPKLQKNLRSFFMGGEVVGPKKRKLLRELYPDKEISIGYGMHEMGGAPAIQCQVLAGQEGEALFHPRVNDCYFEIINPETGEEVPFEEEGELVLTNFRNQATPLIRYKTGDMASFRENNCFCGAPGPLLRIHGRINYDIVRVGGFELRSEMLEIPLMNLSSYVKDEFEVNIYETFVENKPKLKIELNLSLKEGVVDSPEIRWKIEQELLENWRLSPRLNLKKAVEAGLFEIPQIKFVRFPQAAKPIRKFILH